MKVEDLLFMKFGKKIEDAKDKELLEAIKLKLRYYIGKSSAKFEKSEDYIFITEDIIETPDIYRYFQNMEKIEEVSKEIRSYKDFEDLLLLDRGNYVAKLSKDSLFFYSMCEAGYTIKAFNINSCKDEYSFISRDSIEVQYGGKMSIYIKENGKFGVSYEDVKNIKICENVVYPLCGESKIQFYKSVDNDYKSVAEEINIRSIVNEIVYKGQFKNKIILGKINLELFISELMRVFLDQYEMKWNEAIDKVKEGVVRLNKNIYQYENKTMDSRNKSILEELQRRNELDNILELNCFKEIYCEDYLRLKDHWEKLGSSREISAINRLNRKKLMRVIYSLYEVVLGEDCLYICDFEEDEKSSKENFNYFKELYETLEVDPNKYMPSIVYIFFGEPSEEIKEILHKINSNMEIKNKLKVINLNKSNSYLLELVYTAIDMGVNCNFYQKLQLEKYGVITLEDESLRFFFAKHGKNLRNRLEYKEILEEKRKKYEGYEIYNRLFK